MEKFSQESKGFAVNRQNKRGFRHNVSTLH